MDAQHIKQVLKTHKERLFTTYPLTSIALFGSYADGTASEESDIDIMVEFSRPVGFEFIDLTIELENLLHKKIDIVTRKAVKPSLMSYIQPQLQYV
ncbi:MULTISPECIES: nucleotidyltransferase family protein [Spirosoma]|uniref:Nucleotidyltransferase n=1 Tax=Spirosoma sordidisoli TaxID=2502893 RepID=A0A4Q2UM12_9BACT|nr:MULTISPECIES: nucleotidyltransferase family protein [Spirosoma]RYC68751.1 nucleotidyltransferase [Spirosoma sordidisoli]